MNFYTKDHAEDEVLQQQRVQVRREPWDKAWKIRLQLDRCIEDQTSGLHQAWVWDKVEGHVENGARRAISTTLMEYY